MNTKPIQYFVYSDKQYNKIDFNNYNFLDIFVYFYDDTPSFSFKEIGVMTLKDGSINKNLVNHIANIYDDIMYSEE